MTGAKRQTRRMVRQTSQAGRGNEQNNNEQQVAPDRRRTMMRGNKIMWCHGMFRVFWFWFFVFPNNYERRRKYQNAPPTTATAPSTNRPICTTAAAANTSLELLEVG